MTLIENENGYFTNEEAKEIADACAKIEAAMGLSPEKNGKLMLTLKSGEQSDYITVLSFSLPKGAGENCAYEKTRALIENPTKATTDQCVFQVGDQTVSWQGGIKVALDKLPGASLIIAFSGLAGWQDLFFSFGTAIVLSKRGSFCGGYGLPPERVKELANQQDENAAIYALVSAILQ